MKVNINSINLTVQNYLNALNPNWIVNVIEREHYNLAEHHLYGSARLGIKGYWPQQLYSLWDYSDTTAFIIDTTLLQSRQPWYSAMYQDGIKPDVTVPWNSTFINPIKLQTILGQKQYEETDHLGNVVITASDKKYPLADISDSLITAYHAELPSTYDYYPFGMLMPGRYTSDTSTQCATITQTVMVPSVTTYTDPLSTYATYNLMPSAISGVTPTTINIATTAANQGITLALVNVALFKDNTFELTVNRIPTGLKYIAEIYEYNLNDTLLLTSKSVDRDATFTLNFKPMGSGNIGLVLKSINSLSTTATTKFANFFTTVTTYTSQSITSTICNTGGDRYRFGYNGQEKTNEIAGIGNHNTALFWEYDTRLARRWNIDPVDQMRISNYACFGDNPIVYADLLGNQHHGVKKPKNSEGKDGDGDGSGNYEKVNGKWKKVKGEKTTDGIAKGGEEFRQKEGNDGKSFEQKFDQAASDFLSSPGRLLRFEDAVKWLDSKMPHSNYDKYSGKDGFNRARPLMAITFGSLIVVCSGGTTAFMFTAAGATTTATVLSTISTSSILYNKVNDIYKMYTGKELTGSHLSHNVHNINLAAEIYFELFKHGEVPNPLGFMDFAIDKVLKEKEKNEHKEVKK